MPGVRQQSNFSHLKAHDEQLERLGLLAERYFADDPNTRAKAGMAPSDFIQKLKTMPLADVANWFVNNLE
jgi:hypothetical protein